MSSAPLSGELSIPESDHLNDLKLAAFKMLVSVITEFDGRFCKLSDGVTVKML